jgi:hypothetical protein
MEYQAMQEGTRAVLKATGETVTILAAIGENRYLAQLPPQQPGHKPRHQEIRGDKLRFSNR